jgi:hypothetical protein
MDINTVKRVVADLSAAVEVVEASLVAQHEVKELEKRKEDAETAYRLAVADRAQIVEAIENLKAQFAEAQAHYQRENQRLVDQHTEDVAKAEKAVQEFIASMGESAEEAEAHSRERIKKANAAADEAEARVVKAQEALEALKRA